MSYTTQLFTIDLEKLRRFYGSKDEPQLAAIYSSSSEDLESLDERFSDEIESGDEWPMAEDALAEICAGRCIFTEASPLYGYVLEIICRNLGQHVATLGPLKMHPYRSGLLALRSPIPIPTSDDFPGISFLEPSQIAAELEMVRSTDRPDDECIAEDIDDYQTSLENAISEGLSIVAFYY